MANTRIKKISDTATERLEKMVKSGEGAQAFLRLRILPLYQELQRERFKTENASEGAVWKSLNSKYADSKPVRFGSYPGGGRKIMIATGALFEGTAISPDRIVTQRSITISVSSKIQNPVTGSGVLDYARYAAQVRPVMEFGKQSVNRFKKEINDWIMQRGEFRGK